MLLFYRKFVLYKIIAIKFHFSDILLFSVGTYAVVLQILYSNIDYIQQQPALFVQLIDC